MEYVVDAAHRVIDAARLAHVANVEFDLGVVERDAHVLLLLLIATEDVNFRKLCIYESLEYRVAKGASTAGDQQGFVFEHLHLIQQ